MLERRWNFGWTELSDKHVGIVQSLIVTCRLHGIDVYIYLVDVLQRVSQHPASAKVLTASTQASGSNFAGTATPATRFSALRRPPGWYGVYNLLDAKCHGVFLRRPPAKGSCPTVPQMCTPNPGTPFPPAS